MHEYNPNNIVTICLEVLNVIYGKLIYSPELDRLDIKTESTDSVGGLHCGDCIEVLLDGTWHTGRVEYGDDWYLYDLYEEGQIPRGLNVRY
jgi:hypothetical protein